MSRRKRDVPTPSPEHEPDGFLRDQDHEYDNNNIVSPPAQSSGLKTKKSWFSSVRDTFSRSALQARSAVEHLRGEYGGKSFLDDADEYEDRGRNLEEGQGSFGQPSSAGDSLTPLRPDQTERPKTFTPRKAVDSLRAHMHQSAAKRDRKKRGALAGVIDNVGHEAIEPSGPEKFVDDPLEGLETTENPPTTSKGHGRKSSVAQSLVGSLRALSRRGTNSTKYASPTKEVSANNRSPIKQAVSMPLPSSPIDIPAPNLDQLDLGPSALMSSSFINSPELERRGELMALTDPSWKQRERVPTYYTRLPGEGPSDRPILPASDVRDTQVMPLELLEMSVDDFGFSLPKGPSTPGTMLTGTMFDMDLDGTKDVTAVFERSVESKNSTAKQENRRLKKMASIDALAETGSPRAGGAAVIEKARENSGSSTISNCPSDMPPLTRQINQRIATLQSPGIGPTDAASDQWKIEDPFAPKLAAAKDAISRVPSPTRSLVLPIRPKIRVQSVDGSQPRTIDVSPGRLDEEDDIPLAILAQQKARARMALGTATNFMFNTPSDGKMERLHHEPLFVDDLHQVQDGPGQAVAPSEDIEETGPVETSGQNAAHRGEATKDEHKGNGSHDSSPISPMVASVYKFMSKAHTPSPTQNRPGTTHSPDMGKMFWGPGVWGSASRRTTEVDQWKDPVQRWIQSQDESTGTPNVQPSPRACTEQADVVSISIDEDRVTPPISPRDSTPSGTPSIGDRLEFDARRSERNMRYNALVNISNVSPNERECQQASAQPPETPSPLRPVLKILTENIPEPPTECDTDSDMKGGNVAPSPSPTSEFRKTLARDGTKELSSDSIESDLQEALQDSYIFQVAMSGLDLNDSPGNSRHIAPPSDPPGPFPENTEGVESGYIPLHSSPTPPGANSPTSDTSSKGSKDYTFVLQPDKAEELTPSDHPVADADMPPEELDDTLDDALAIYVNYNASQQDINPPPSIPQQGGNPFESSPSCCSGNISDSSASIEACKPAPQDSDLARFEKLADSPGSLRRSRPARYRSRKNLCR